MKERKFQISFSRVDWVNTAFLATITLLSLFVVPVFFWRHGMDWFQFGMMMFFIVSTGMSITLGYHRLFSHLSFKAKFPIRFFTLIFGACAFENSALNWCSDHRRHHKFTDEEDDPYDITKGFFWAHIGWILFKENPEPPLDNVRDLQKDKLVMWQSRWDKVIAVLVGLLLPTLLGFCWERFVQGGSGTIGAWSGFLYAGVFRVFAVQQCTFFINSLCHCVGTQPYSTNCTARDSFLMSLFTFGEGYHNYHHTFQHDYRNGVKAWNFDPTKWAIWCLSKMGLISDLRRVPESKIVLAQIKAARRQADAQRDLLLASEDSPWRQEALNSVHRMSEKLAEIYAELELATAEKVDLSRKKLRAWSRETRELLDSLTLACRTPTGDAAI